MSGRRRKMQRVGVVAKRSSQEAVGTAAELAEWLRRRGLEVSIDATAGCDLVVVLGGDGTLLSVARALDPGVPILGVNLGNLGFLTEIGRADLYPALLHVLAGRFHTHARTLFDVERRGDTRGPESYRVLNDAVVTKSALSRIIELTIEVDGHLIARYRSDGLIISTPTGSTAYSLSAGRPIVVPGSSRIEVSLETQREEVFLTLDGQEGTELRYRETVAVTESAAAVHLVKISDRSFYDNLREKLRWGGLTRPDDGGGAP